MLTKEQQKQVKRGFDIGFSDTHIARAIGGINQMQVYHYRHKFGISSQIIVNRRYDVWTHLIYNGVSIDEIARLYEVTERSIRVLLWKQRRISLIDARAAVQARPEFEALSVDTRGIPDFGQGEL